ncbi:ADRA1B (predicted) [Pycnogonum litorale]
METTTLISIDHNFTAFAKVMNKSATEPQDDSVVIDNLPLFLTKTLALTVIVFATVGGNVLVLLAVFLNTHLRSTTNYFIANLALADLLLGSTVLPFSATVELTKKWLFGDAICNIWVTSDVLYCTASINSLCVISVDRYIGVTKPLGYSSIMTKRKAKLCCLGVWLVSGLISVTQILGFREAEASHPYECPITETDQYVMFSVLGSFYIPTVIILFVYWKIYIEASKQTKFLRTGIKVAKGTSEDGCRDGVTLRIHTGGNSKHNRKFSTDERFGSTDKISGCRMSAPGIYGKLAKFKRQKKAAKTLGIVVGVYILCWLPFFALLPIRSLCSSCEIPHPLFDFAFWLGYCNSCLNPIIYAFSSRDFKKAFKRLLKFECNCGNTRSRSSYAFDECRSRRNCQSSQMNTLELSEKLQQNNEINKNKFVENINSEREDDENYISVRRCDNDFDCKIESDPSSSVMCSVANNSHENLDEKEAHRDSADMKDLKILSDCECQEKIVSSI